MTQYRFHISDCEVAFFDENGIDLPTPSIAFDEATATAWILMYELADAISDWSDWRVDVVDGKRQRCPRTALRAGSEQRALNLLTSAL